MPSGSAPIRAASGRVFVGDAVTRTELPDDKPQSGLCKGNPCATGVGVWCVPSWVPACPSAVVHISVSFSGSYLVALVQCPQTFLRIRDSVKMQLLGLTPGGSD